MRNQRAPVEAAVPAVVVPGEIQHQDVQRNAVPAQPGDLVLQVIGVVALEGGRLRCRTAREVLEVEVGDPGTERVAGNHRDRPAQRGIVLEHAAIVATVGEQIPVLLADLLPRLDPLGVAVPHRRGAVIDERIAAAAEQPRLGLRQADVDAGDDVVYRALQVVAVRRQVDLGNVVQRIGEPAQIARIHVTRMPCAKRRARRVVPTHLEILRIERSRLQPVAHGHGVRARDQPAVLPRRVHGDGRPVPFLHDSGRCVDERCGWRVLHPQQRRGQELEAGIARHHRAAAGAYDRSDLARTTGQQRDRTCNEQAGRSLAERTTDEAHDGDSPGNASCTEPTSSDRC